MSSASDLELTPIPESDPKPEPDVEDDPDDPDDPDYQDEEEEEEEEEQKTPDLIFVEGPTGPSSEVREMLFRSQLKTVLARGVLALTSIIYAVGLFAIATL